MIKQESLVQERMERLGLSFMAANLESFLANQVHNNAPLVEILADLMDLELIPRKQAAVKKNLGLSRLPIGKSLDNFELDWLKGGMTEKQFNELKTLSFIDRKENVILLGPSGIGKTHLMTALGMKACANGIRVYFISCVDLIERLKTAKKQGKLNRKLGFFKGIHILLIDEVGYENLSSEEAALFFQLINTRYEYNSIIITSNKPFGKWGEMMSEDAIASATLDRLLHHALVFSLKGDSYRMKNRMKIGVVDF